jgi:thioredoxin 1
LTPDRGTGSTVVSADDKEADVSSAVTDLDEKTFDEEIQSCAIPVMVEFWAQWCPPCKALAPVLDELAAEYEHRLRVVRVNADEQPALAARYEVTSVPTMLLLCEGEIQRRMVGARSRARLVHDIADVITS